MSAAFDLPSLNSASSFFLLIFARLVTEWLNTDLAQGLAPVVDNGSEGALAGAIAEERSVVLELNVVTVDIDRV
jgi:hypothetical protein